jgi:hypothetical protein
MRYPSGFEDQIPRSIHTYLFSDLHADLALNALRLNRGSPHDRKVDHLLQLVDQLVRVGRRHRDLDRSVHSSFHLGFFVYELGAARSGCQAADRSTLIPSTSSCLADSSPKILAKNPFMRLGL